MELKQGGQEKMASERFHAINVYVNRQKFKVTTDHNRVIFTIFVYKTEYKSLQ